MRLFQYASGSTGNFYVIEATNGHRLLIECGIVWKSILKHLKYNLNDIEGCFVSHIDHQDHSKAVKDVLGAGIDTYSSNGSWETVKGEIGHRAKVIAHETLVRLNSFEVLAFNVNHDAKEPLGFVVREKETGEFLLFATDTSHIEYELNYPFSIVAIECSYDRDILSAMVENDDINESLARRLLTSHMEKQATKNHLDKFDLSKCREIHLLHLSKANIDNETTAKEFADRYFREVITI